MEVTRTGADPQRVGAYAACTRRAVVVIRAIAPDIAVGYRRYPAATVVDSARRAIRNDAVPDSCDSRAGAGAYSIALMIDGTLCYSMTD